MRYVKLNNPIGKITVTIYKISNLGYKSDNLREKKDDDSFQIHNSLTFYAMRILLYIVTHTK